MTDYIDTREGWRLWTGETDLVRPLLRLENPDGSSLYWVRESRVPQLPTEPGTVIEVVRTATDLNDRVQQWLLLDDGTWTLVRGVGTYWEPSRLLYQIASYRVISEPRAVTAKAVLDRVRELGSEHATRNKVSVITRPVDQVAREFGVES